MSDAALSARDVAAMLRPLVRGAPLLDRFKATYRAYICPLPDVLEQVPPHSAVLDIGCGGGMLLALVAAHRQPRSLTGVEVSEAPLRLARRVLADAAKRIPVTLALHEGGGVPEQASSADVVTMVDVLHHIPRSEQIPYLQRLAAAMRPGARLILKDIDAARPFLRAANRLHDLLLAGEVGHERRFEEVLEIVQKTGMSVVATSRRRMLVYPHFQIVADKV